MATTSKKRKHAPSPDIFAHSPSSPTHPHTRPWQPILDAPLRDLGKEFARFLNHLHDAAVLINHPNEQQPRQYSRVSVLLLGWQDDPASTDNIRSLQDVFESDYQYSTHTWYLPTTAKPIAQLSVRMTSFLEQARPDDLLIVYYYGHGYQGTDGQIYWACTTEDRSAKLKWDTFQCLFEDVQCDMLLFLDTCSVPITIASNRSVKQIVAAYSPETAQYTSPAALGDFTPCLVAALRNLSRARSFSVQALCHEIKDNSIANSKSGHPFPSTALAPEFFVMTPDKPRDLQLPVLPCSTPVTTREPARAVLNPTPTSASMPLDFDEPRVLVCTTVAGAECPSISTIHSWMQNTPALASQLTVEGMFLGPPTVLTLSMPSNLWNNVQHDKIWYCLGTVKSRNMAHLYDKMFSPPPLAKPTPTIPQDPSPVPTAAKASRAIHLAHSRQNSISMTHRSSPLQPGYLLPRAIPAVKVAQSPSALMYQSPPPACPNGGTA
ncbi:hypothetical protein NLG97_g3172 [Lecanicillium saksenae]|uniref:Uncharacterized protein n=1 Tax=Lecanicillium saksenae TaxID=468837 RepID=A0ACC1R241_9HYPO|nr:hypothetical protein NLG97_g3172 [Lecanicillium saksenae]